MTRKANAHILKVMVENLYLGENLKLLSQIYPIKKKLRRSISNYWPSFEKWDASKVDTDQ